MARYAAFTTAHLVATVAVFAGLADFVDPGLLLLALSLPLVFAWGLFHADLAMNPDLDDDERRRWRMVLWVLPWTMGLYWYLHVRPRRVDR